MELLTERLRLREFVVEDHEAVHRYASDPEATRYTDWGPNAPQATEVFLAEAQASAAYVPRSRYALAIVRHDRNELIGSVELQITSQEDGCGVLGYVLGHDSWGQGYATEAAAGMLRYGFVELRLRSISATCDPDNAASAAVLEKIGMHQVGHLHHHVYSRGEWRDRLQFTCPSRWLP
jgi:RimJ/RimL family protein N-acetyltransferase